MKVSNKKSFYFVLLLPLFFYACQHDISNDNSENIDSADNYKLPAVKTGKFYKSELSSNNSVIIADTVTYDVLIKNDDPEDDWKKECLKNIDIQALADIIFNAVYNKRLQAYDYQTEQPLSIEEVKKMEKRYPRKRIAKMQFVEEWYFNEETMEMGKRVNAIMLAYENRNYKGEISGYKAGIKVFLNNKKENRKANSSNKEN